MEVQQWWSAKFSFRNATIVVCLLNVITAILLLQRFLSSANNRDRFSNRQSDSVQLRYIKESEEIRLAMRPLDLIKRVREIEQEAYTKPRTVPKKDTKQTAAVDLSKRLKDFRSLNDAASIKETVHLSAYEETRMANGQMFVLIYNFTTFSSNHNSRSSFGY